MIVEKQNGLKREVIGDFNVISVTVGNSRFDISVKGDFMEVYKINTMADDIISIQPRASNVITLK